MTGTDAWPSISRRRLQELGNWAVSESVPRERGLRLCKGAGPDKGASLDAGPCASYVEVFGSVVDGRRRQ